MSTTAVNENRRLFLKKRLRTKTILLNAIAEFLAVIIFTSLYFIFISRYITEEFTTNYIALSFSIGLAFFAAIYIPFHTYRIHIIPFITIISALRKRDPFVLVHKIPAQVLGSLVGVLIFNAINNYTTQINIEDYQLVHLQDYRLSILINGLTAAILCYGYYMIRILFQAKQLWGTIYLSLFVAVLFAMTGFFSTVSALNPFGYLFYDLLENRSVFNQNFVFVVVNHILAPIAGALLLYYLHQSKNHRSN